ncbi:hypothetical protein DVT68_00530 [Dyella solisilvae]|uniref:Lipoprotein n=1 Tax=Dyella solisilvae TaxID=1920168 RepID=A0A370K9U4_9GAMM|nr:DUF6491 family protein [Dyella solisilvae]RDI99385.1 hypothetical protein DVT68_00530 [Dyella solisilvae]
MPKAPFALLAAGLLVGCASTSTTLTTQQRLELYQQHAGAPIESFRIDNFIRTRSWTPLGDQALAVWPLGSDGYLLELRGQCFGLSTSPRISITNSRSQIVTRSDSVVPAPLTIKRPIGAYSCRIQSIRPLDTRALHDAKRELRDAELIDRSAAPPEQDEQSHPAGN